jgi:hypothetical protein
MHGSILSSDSYLISNLFNRNLIMFSRKGATGQKGAKKCPLKSYRLGSLASLRESIVMPI